MNRKNRRCSRILAIDPTHRGFGFAVLEYPDKLIDWGVKDIRRNRIQETANKVRELIEIYSPDALVLEDCTVRGCRRGARAREVIARIVHLAGTMGMKTRRVSAVAVRRHCAAEGASTKEQIAIRLAARFPELTSLLPPKRKPWMSEDERMAVFDALSLAMSISRRYDLNRSDKIEL